MPEQMVMVDRRQQGVALLTAILVVTLASLLAVSMTHREAVAVKRGQNMMAREQAFQVALGLEDWAIVFLRRDAAETGAVDSRQEAWAQGLPTLPTDRGFVTGRMEDLDGRLNLNNLAAGGVRRGQEIARMRRLLLALGLDPLLAEAIADWQDPDSIASPDGAEDDHYTREQPAYRAGNRDFVHLSELRLVAGIDQRVFETLEPHVAILPILSEPTRVNVNTATPPVLMSLHQAITPEIAERWWADGRAAHKSVTKFLEQSQLSPQERFEIRELITVDSRYFLAQATVSVDDRNQVFFSVIEQGDRGFHVIQRSRGVF
jgi:general secretion pathway protein K